MELLTEITIPEYPRKFVKSNNVRPKYFEKGRKKIPLKYCNKNLHKTQGILEPDGINYGWQAFPAIRKKVKRHIDFLVDLKTGERVVANTKHVGHLQEANISGQAIYNGMIGRHTRNNMMGTIKDYFRKYMKDLPPITRFPIIIIVELHDMIVDVDFSKGQDWDIDNRAYPYSKNFQDMLKDCKIIPEDNRFYITGAPAPRFVPVDKSEDRKLVFKIYKDDRLIIKLNPLYIAKLGKSIL